MIKKFFVILALIFIITGCGSNNDKENDKNKNVEGNTEKNDKLIIKTKVSNKTEKGNYLIYFMHVGERNEKKGEANQSAFGPFETDENGEYVLDLNYNFDHNVGSYLKSGNNKEADKLELFIVTKEDKYIRNPLNKKTIVEFIKNDSKEEYPNPEFFSKEREIEVPFIDKYPDGVISLTFQDAIFVIKLEFEGEIPKKSYEVSIFWNDPSVPSGIGIVRIGRISREFQYWDTPFFKEDKLASKTGTIIIKDFDTNETVNYDGYPKKVSFDKDGNPIGDKIVKLRIK